MGSGEEVWKFYEDYVNHPTSSYPTVHRMLAMFANSMREAVQKKSEGKRRTALLSQHLLFTNSNEADIFTKDPPGDLARIVESGFIEKVSIHLAEGTIADAKLAIETLEGLREYATAHSELSVP